MSLTSGYNCINGTPCHICFMVAVYWLYLKGFASRVVTLARNVRCPQ